MKKFLNNPPGYTAGQFAEDVTAMLPFALPEYQKSGQMMLCAHCGIAHQGGCFAIEASGELDTAADVEIVSVCDVCAAKPALPPPAQWAHVGAASGLFVAQEDWATFTTGLRWLGALALREKFGFPLVAKLLHADGPLRDACNAMIFFDGSSSSRTREAPFIFPWESDKLVFAGGGSIKVALEAALRYGSVMIFGELCTGSPKQGGAM
jgi:hypothetical protein